MSIEHRGCIDQSFTVNEDSKSAKRTEVYFCTEGESLSDVTAQQGFPSIGDSFPGIPGIYCSNISLKPERDGQKVKILAECSYKSSSSGAALFGESVYGKAFHFKVSPVETKVPFLYSYFRNGDIGESRAALIADVARGDEAIEAAGIKAKGLSLDELSQYLKLLKNTPKVKTEQGDLFGFDDSALKTAETLAKLASKHIKGIHEKVLAAKGAIKNPDAAKKLGVSVGNDAKGLYQKALLEEQEWEHWETNRELYNQLLEEAGLKGNGLDGGAETTETSAETKEANRGGNEDVPLLTAEEDSRDFQLVSETEAESARRDALREKEEKERAERLKREAAKNTMDLPMPEEKKTEFVKKNLTVLDKEILEKYQKPEEFSKLMESRIRKLVGGMNLDASVKDDMIQSILVDVWQKTLPKFDPNNAATPTAFFDTAIHNFKNRYLKNTGMEQQKKVSLDEEVTDDGLSRMDSLQDKGVSPEKEIENSELKNAIEDFRKSLNKVDQSIFDAMGESDGHIAMGKLAKEIGISKSNLAVRVNKIRENLKKHLAENTGVKYSVVGNRNLLKRLNEEEQRGEYVTLYRSAQLRDGKLYPPMAAKINGEWVQPIELGKWEQSDEHPELVDEDGQFKLNKGNGSTITAAYNPYLHSSPTPLNDQFFTAYKRPELVTIEVRVPKSELTSGYHADKAKDAVGMHDWGRRGPVQRQLDGQRQVMLSRYDKPIRIVPDAEVAEKIKEVLGGKNVSIPSNVLTPSLREELEKIGVEVMDENGVVRSGTEKGDSLRGSTDPEISQMVPVRNAGNQSEAVAALKTFSGMDIINRETGIPAQINSEQRNKLVSSKSREKSNRNGFSNKDHFHAVANIDSLYENASLVDDRPDKDGNPDVISIKRFVAPVLLNEEFAEAYITVKETVGNRLYSLELDELKKPSDIQGGTLQKDRYHIPEGYSNLLRKIEKAREYLKNSENTPDMPDRQDRTEGENSRFSTKGRFHQQENPVQTAGPIRDEYEQLLRTKKYQPETFKEWNDKAAEWITRQGGYQQAMKQIIAGNEHPDRQVATIARKLLFDSIPAEKKDKSIRQGVEQKHIEAGTEWGREGAARRIAAITMSDIDNVRNLIRKLTEKMPGKEKVKLRNDVLDATGVDVFDLPENIVEDKPKLDKVLREALSRKANIGDKLYEYWINAILSGLKTNTANIIGNTTNVAYELGPKRFAEAAINLVARRKDAATFGEFKQMWKYFDIKKAREGFLDAFNLETLTPEGKFVEGKQTAISGQTGRTVRIPSRVLNAEDMFFMELLVPVETATQAYREAKAKGLKGSEMQRYVQSQVEDRNGEAYRKAVERVKEMIFHENPGKAVEYLVSMKSQNTPGAWILKFMLPFVKTPSNIIGQGIRKSPLGSLNLAYEAGSSVLGKRKFDSKMIEHTAEQLLAWSTFLMLAHSSGWGDDEDKKDKYPLITGSSAKYGSGEHQFKANQVPPYSIRIGDKYYSYQRIEPLATGLAAIADAIQVMHETKNGKDASKAISDMMKRQGRVLTEKSYLDSIRQVIQFVEDPERSAASFGTTWLSSWVPNIVKSARNSADDYYRDNKVRDKDKGFFEDQFNVVKSKAGFSRRVPKVDLFGEEITKEEAGKIGDFGDVLWRIVMPVDRRKIDDENPGKNLIWNYNSSHPDSQYWGSLPNNRFQRNGKKYYFNDEDYHDYAIKAGQLADRQIRNAEKRGLLDVKNPGEKDIELVKKIFSRARKEIRDEKFRTGEYSEE